MKVPSHVWKEMFGRRCLTYDDLAELGSITVRTVPGVGAKPMGLRRARHAAHAGRAIGGAELHSR